MEILKKLMQLGEIGVVEYEFAEFLYRVDAQIHQDLLFLSVLVIKDQLNGNICTHIDSFKDSELANLLGISELKKDTLTDLISKSVVIGNPGDYVPLILEENRVYLQKFWNYEQELIEWLKEKIIATQNISVAKLLKRYKGLINSDNKIDFQKIAVTLSVLNDFLIISGGPGTGKTYTIQQIVKFLLTGNSDLSIGMAAPTGKAAERLNVKISEERVIQGITIHRLLGARKNGEFTFGKDKKLPYDVIIIDEVSMLDLRLWIGLIRAIKGNTKLILLGDKDQLSSVEAGSVLGDICSEANNSYSQSIKQLLNNLGHDVKGGFSNNIINDNIVLFEKSYRTKEFSGINEFAKAINEQDELLLNQVVDKFNSISVSEPSSELISQIIEEYAVDLIQDQLNTQIICSNNHGVFGTKKWNNLIDQNIKKKKGIPNDVEWYDGKKIIITQNDYSNNLSNGEIGTCFILEGEIKVYFSNERSFYPDQLKYFDMAYAITVHKSQGSEFDHVILCLSDRVNPALSKELLYTGVTRARFSTHVIGYRKVFKYTLQNAGKRKSGLSDKILKEVNK